MPEPINPRSLPVPMRIDPSALADLPDGSVVYSRAGGEVQPVGVMILAAGRWRMAGSERTVRQEELAEEDEALEELRESVSFWVLPLP